MNPAHVVTPLEGLGRALPDAQITVHEGVFPRDRLAPLEPTGDVTLELRDEDGVLLKSEQRYVPHLVLLEGIPSGTRKATLRTRYRADRAGVHTFGVSGAGHFELRLGKRTESITNAADFNDPVELLMKPPQHRVERNLARDEEIDIELGLSVGEHPFTIFGIAHEPPRLTEDEEPPSPPPGRPTSRW